MAIYHLRIIERLWGSNKFAVGAGFHIPLVIVTKPLPSPSSSPPFPPPSSFLPPFSPSSSVLFPSTPSTVSRQAPRPSSTLSWPNTMPQSPQSISTASPHLLLRLRSSKASYSVISPSITSSRLNWRFLRCLVH